MLRFASTLFLVVLVCASVFAQPGPEIRWQREFPNRPWISMADLVRSDAGDLYVTGEIQTATRDDFFVSKYTEEGDSLWTHQFGLDTIQEVIGKACITTDGRLCVAGFQERYTTDPDSPSVVCLDRDGNQLWATTLPFSPPAADFRGNIAAMPHGDLAVVTLFYTPIGQDGFSVIRLNSRGDSVWTRRLYFDDLGFFGSVYAVSTSPAGDIAFITDIMNGPMCASSLIQLDSTGQLRSVVFYRSDYAHISLRDVAYADDGWWVVGYYDQPNIERETFVGRARLYGDSLWNRIINEDLSVHSEAIQPLPDHGALIGGPCDPIGSNRPGLFLERLDAEGAPLWRNVYICSTGMGTLNFGLTTDNRGHHYFAADFFPFAYSIYATETDSIDLAADPRSPRIIPDRLTVSGLYPNPFNGTARVQLTLASGAETELQIVNLLGQTVSTQRAGYLGPGLHELPLSLPLQASGTYWLTVRTPQASAQAKLQYIK